MGKSKRIKGKKQSEKVTEKGGTLLEVFEAHGLLETEEQLAQKQSEIRLAQKLSEISRQMREYPEPEPAFLPPDDENESEPSPKQQRELSDQELRRIRKRVELLEDLSPMLRAGDVMLKYSEDYIKAGEGKRDRVFNERRRGILGWLFPPVKVSHPNHFRAVHVEALPYIFKKLN